ncbi:LysM peptidoglycan-binding domain-containing protein [Kocuria coralli]|uniref:LysM peptidoglycan-binding domain-containing protein n=1 Tax=Kocuria coralli TaxID=1461025 RepID=A0A5J5KVL1_9MICC|nr:LysM peptidoglycan-binding domain-containing protein [Kocuria coralli]KAA9393614.1 LysM peptidoglycan-binding domain-containing protein [Kocuria coralli]
MSAISFVPRLRGSSSDRPTRAPLLRGLRSGCRAFTGEVVAAVPVLRRRSDRQERAAWRAPVHLTRRGRLLFIGLPVMVATAAVAVALVILIAPATVTASTDPVEGPGTEIVTVGSGDTLWEIALAADSERDTRIVVSDIVELNDLETQAVTTGQQLLVPAR